MGRTDWGPIIIGGGLLVGGIYAWINWKTVCPAVFGETSTMCKGETPLDALAQYNNNLPSITDNPRTNEYKSTRIVGRASDPAVTATFKRQAAQGQAAANQVKQTVARKNALPEATERNEYCAGAFCKQYPNMCPKCKGGKWVGYTDFNSFNTITLNRMSVR